MKDPGCEVCGALGHSAGEGCPDYVPDTTAELQTPPDLTGFRVLRLLGQGGMGTVYLAEDLSLGRRVAIKVLGPQQSGDVEARDRFLREARALAGIDHPNVVRIHSLGSTDSKTFIVMEYVDGESLADRIARGPMAPADAIRVASQAAAGLAAAWAKGIVHRDVKPSNILLAAGDHVRVADFGLAKPIQVDPSFVTLTGIVLGTPHYIAPEQARGEAVDLRTDIYSLGVTLYEMATGSRPFKGRTPLEILAHHLHTPMPALPSGQLLPGLAHAIARMTAKSPADRPGSFAELSELLEAARRMPTGETEAETTTTAVAVPLDRQGGPITEPVETTKANAIFAAPELSTAPNAPAAPLSSRGWMRPSLRSAGIVILGAALLAWVAVRTGVWQSLVKRLPFANAEKTPTYGAGEVDTPPVLLSTTVPPTVAASQEGCLGTVSVVLHFVVTETGEVTEIALDPRADPAVAGSAVLYLSGRKYSPASKAGVPVRVRSKWRYTSLSEFKTLEALQSQALLIEEGKMRGDQVIGCVASLGRVLAAGLPGPRLLDVSTPGRAEALKALLAIPRTLPTLEDGDLLFIGETLARAGYQPASIQIFEMALARLPETAEGYELIADGFVDAGDKGKALRAYRLAASLDPNRESTKAKLSALNSEKVALPAGQQAREFYRGVRVYGEAEVEKSPLLFSHSIPKPALDPGRVVSVTGSWIVTPDGSVDEFQIVRSGGPDVDSFVVDSVKTWRYEPGQKDGKVVPVRVLRKYTFGARGGQ